MSGRIIQNADADTSPKKAVRKVHVKAPIVSSLRQDEIAREMHENEEKKQRNRIMKNEFEKLSEDFKKEREAKERELKK